MNELNKKKNRHIRQQMVRVMQQQATEAGTGETTGITSLNSTVLSKEGTDGSSAAMETTGGYVDWSTLNETEYFYANGYRMVWPYNFAYRARAKARWYGRTLREIARDEFASFSDEYFDMAQKLGRIMVDGEAVSADHVLANNSLFTHLVHRHEPAVRDDPIEVVHRDFERGLIVINKPCTIPVHPCGKFRQNTVVYILARENNLKNVHVVHRLDRATSGLMIMALNSQAAAEVGEQLRGHVLQKHYLARVRGRFPFTLTDAQSLSSPNEEGDISEASFSLLSPSNSVLMWDGVSAVAISPQDLPTDFLEEQKARLDLSNAVDSTPESLFPWRENRVEITVDRPVVTACNKFGIYGVGKRGDPNSKGKDSLTVFRAISYDASTDTSLVHCMPKTGRTHQIRVHLTHLGFPIANDERYGGVESKQWWELKGLPPRARPVTKGGLAKNMDENIEDTMTQQQVYARREELWLSAYDPFCLFCRDVNAGVWKDRFHFVRQDTQSLVEAPGLTGLHNLNNQHNKNHGESSDSSSISTSKVKKEVEVLAEYDYASIVETHREYLASLETTKKTASQGGEKMTERKDNAPPGCVGMNVPKPENLIPRLPSGEVNMDVLPDVADIDPEREAIWLHAYKYEGPEWTFQVPLPEWAGLGENGASGSPLHFPPFLRKEAVDAYLQAGGSDEEKRKQVLKMKHTMQKKLETMVGGPDHEGEEQESTIDV